MHLVQEEIGMPKVTVDEKNDSCTLISVEPLPSGFGMTLGNALRRTMISSLPGTAITNLKVAGASHEYTTVEGVSDSILDIILSLKKVDFLLEGDEPTKVILNVKKAGKITAKDIKCPSNVSVLNPKLEITNINKSSNLEIEMTIEKGIGYLPITPARQKESENIVLDANFSPIRKVRFEVSPTRVGQSTNLDKLELEITTNGAISPIEAFRFSSQIVEGYFNLFGKKEDEIIEPNFQTNVEKIQAQVIEQEVEATTESYTPIETLELSPRTLNALINGDVGSIEKLVKMNEGQLLNLRGFGKKAYTEIQDALEKKGLKFDNEQ